MNGRSVLTRRQFAKQVFGTASFLALATGGGGGRAARAAADALGNRPRYLINLHNRGGWDAMWWHSYAKPDDVAAWRTGSGASRPLSDYYTDRFPAAQAIAHPADPTQFMGIGMAIFDATDYSRMCIWKGVVCEADHDIGNKIINCGMFSSYATGFSGLISVALAERSTPLPMHYVQVSGSPEELYTSAGLLTGYASGISVPDLSAFQTLTSALSNDLTTPRREALRRVVTALTEQTMSAGFRLKQSRSVYEGYLAAFNGLNVIYGTNMGTSPDFQAVLAAYEDAAVQAFSDLLARYPFLATTLASTGSPSQYSVASSPLRVRIRGAAFPYALAEFLVTRNLSRVLDIGPSMLNDDAHAFNAQEFNTNVIKYSMFRALMRRLAAVECPGTGGQSFLDNTTLLLTTEFDREPVLSLGVPGQPFGTNHGASASFILAGAGIRGGTVIGDFKTAPGAYGRYAQFANTRMCGPLPIDLTTGAVDPNGRLVTTKSFFPTVMAMFGVAIPAQQLTEGIPVPAVMR
jgi:hypothetical protein